MIRGRTHGEVRRYDLFKLLILGVLGAFVLVTRWQPSTAASPAPATMPPIATPRPTEVVPTPTTVPPTIFIDDASERRVGESITLRGRGAAGQVVVVRQNGVNIGQAVADAGGAWRYAIDLTTEGEVIWTAAGRDGDGEFSAESPPLLFTVLPAIVFTPPTLTEPERVETMTGEGIILRGSADPGNIVGLTLNGRVYDLATANERGEWVYSLRLEEAGSYEVAAQLIDSRLDAPLVSDSVTIKFVDG